MSVVTSAIFESGSLFAQGEPGSPLPMLPMLVLLGVLFYFIMLRPQRNEARARQEMLKSLKKNDRVITTAGIYGVITNIQPDADEVTIKVDEGDGALVLTPGP